MARLLSASCGDCEQRVEPSGCGGRPPDTERGFLRDLLCDRVCNGCLIIGEVDTAFLRRREGERLLTDRLRERKPLCIDRERWRCGDRCF